MQTLQTRKIPFRRKLRLGMNHFVYSLRHARLSTIISIYRYAVLHECFSGLFDSSFSTQ